MECEIATIGAGVSGLAAVSKLKAAGRDVICLEATSRVGGRIRTEHDRLAPLPIETGAEFVHGRPPETWELIRRAGLTAYEHTAEALHLEGGRILKKKQVGELADRVLDRLGKTGRRKDESFEAHLRHSRESVDIKAWARLHVEGFNAARSEVVSAASLKQDADAAGKIDGDRSFRILEGYDSIPLCLLHGIADHQAVVHLNSVVERVTWRRGAVEVRARSVIGQEEMVLGCRRLIVTVPLGVLQANPEGQGAIRFDPEPAAILKAAAALAFGQAYRVTLRFENAFWEEADELKRAGFLLSRDQGFFAWWTQHPIAAPLLTGWSAGSAADQFRGLDRLEVAGLALASLSRILKRRIPRPEAIYFHDWQADPFFRGAYSYVPAGHLAVRERLSEPVEETLFFAGEAAERNGHSATVHGAIASGLRAGGLVLTSLEKRGGAGSKLKRTGGRALT